jgi:hypothetical protein
VIRTILVVIYVPLGWLVPVTSHLVFTFRMLDESAVTPTAAAAPDPAVFLALYAGLSLIATLVLARRG